MVSNKKTDKKVIDKDPNSLDYPDKDAKIIKLKFSSTLLDPNEPPMHPVLASDAHFHSSISSENKITLNDGVTPIKFTNHIENIKLLVCGGFKQEILSDDAIFFLVEAKFWLNVIKLDYTKVSETSPSPGLRINNFILLQDGLDTEFKEVHDNKVISINHLRNGLKCSPALESFMEYDQNVPDKYIHRELDCVWICEDAWRYLVDHFGGGPAVPVAYSEIVRNNWQGENILSSAGSITTANSSQRPLANTNTSKTSLSIDETYVTKSETPATALPNHPICYTCHNLSPDLRLGAGGLGMAKERCSRCRSVHYCSRECQLAHWAAGHKSKCIASISSSPVTSPASVASVSPSMAPSFVESRREGLVGLRNIGNSCYLSSCLQALSHVAPLTRLLLSGRHKPDINEGNRDGSGSAALLKEYTALLTQLWLSGQGVHGSVAPNQLKKVLGRLNADYAGFGQHDAHDVLELFLDRLHEDLNRVREKPYCPAPEGDGSDDVGVSEEAWRQHKRRHDSALTQLFGGQLRSRLHCPDPKCGRTAVSFDFTHTLQLALPPPPPSPLWIDVVVLSTAAVDGNRGIQLFPKSPICYTVCLPPPSDQSGKVVELKSWITGRTVGKALSEQLANTEAEELQNNKLQVKLLTLSRDQSRVVAHVTDETSLVKFARTTVRKGGGVGQGDGFDSGKGAVLVLAAYVWLEVQSSSLSSSSLSSSSLSQATSLPEGDDTSTNNVISIFVLQKHWVPSSKSFLSLGIPFCVRVDKTDSCVTVRALIAQLLFEECCVLDEVDIEEKESLLLAIATHLPLRWTDSRGNHLGISDKTLKPVKPVPPAPTTSLHTTKSKLLDVFSTLRAAWGEGSKLEGRREEWAFPHTPDTTLESYVKYCQELASNSGDQLGSPQTKSTNQRDDCIYIVFDWSPTLLQSPVTRGVIESIISATINIPAVASDSRELSTSQATTLDRCLQHFTREEQLDMENAWYCSRCQKHVLAKKTLSLWRLPEVLVLGLKRFEFRGSTSELHALGPSGVMFSQKQKINRLVIFPLDGLDVAPYLPPGCSTDSGTIYDLFAVINHYGRMGFGHYTATAREWRANGLSDQWYSFDDDEVLPCKAESVVSEAAYVLFYRRRTVL